jgi:hypothetical protein
MAIGLTNWFKTTFLGYEEKTVRARTTKGHYKADDKSTPDVNEAYKKVAVKKTKAKKKSSRKKR